MHRSYSCATLGLVPRNSFSEAPLPAGSFAVGLISRHYTPHVCTIIQQRRAAPMKTAFTLVLIFVSCAIAQKTTTPPPPLQVTLIDTNTIRLPNGNYMVTAQVRFSDAMIAAMRKQGSTDADQIRLGLMCGGSHAGCEPLEKARPTGFNTFIRVMRDTARTMTLAGQTSAILPDSRKQSARKLSPCIAFVPRSLKTKFTHSQLQELVAKSRFVRLKPTQLGTGTS